LSKKLKLDFLEKRGKSDQYASLCVIAAVVNHNPKQD